MQTALLYRLQDQANKSHLLRRSDVIEFAWLVIGRTGLSNLFNKAKKKCPPVYCFVRRALGIRNHGNSYSTNKLLNKHFQHLRAR